VCAPLGFRSIGAKCVVHADCSPTLACYQGACAAVCTPPDSVDRCAGTYSACVHYDDAQEFWSCNIACNLETSAPCGLDLTGRVESIDGASFTQCETAGTKGLGQPCNRTSECTRNLVCAPSTASSFCRRYCSHSYIGCTCDLSNAVTVNGMK